MYGEKDGALDSDVGRGGGRRNRITCRRDCHPNRLGGGKKVGGGGGVGVDMM
jgi:hypothetical protein